MGSPSELKSLFPTIVQVVVVFLAILRGPVYARDDFILTCGYVPSIVMYNIYVSPADNPDAVTPTLIKSLGVPTDVTYDPIEDKIYWIEKINDWVTWEDGHRTCTSTSRIGRIDFDGGNQHYVITNDSPGGDCTSHPRIELDIQSRYLFWIFDGPNGFKVLKRATLTGGDITTLGTGVPTGYSSNDISFDPLTRNIYWANQFPIALKATNIDNGKTTTIIGSEFGITGVAVDSKGRRLFLTKGSEDVVQTTDMEGRNRRVLFRVNDTSTYHTPTNPIAYQDEVYWIMAGEDNTGKSNRNLYRVSATGDDSAVRVDMGYEVDCLHIHSTEAYATVIPTHRQFISRYPTEAPTEDIISTTRGNIDPRLSNKSTSITSTDIIVIMICLVITITVTVSAFYLVWRLVTKNRNIPRYRLESNISVDSRDVDDNIHSDPESHERCVITAVSGRGFVMEKELHPDELKIEGLIGCGAFGVVHTGWLLGDSEHTPVAIKTLKDGASDALKADFYDEIKLNIAIGSHPNILSIIGCITVQEPYYMVMEFMKYGDLLNFLKKCGTIQNIMCDKMYNVTDINQLQISEQIAKGMEYLETTPYYHSDLAARNILVGEGLVVKVSDFGFAGDMYTQIYERIIPEKRRSVKWMSIETNRGDSCTIQNDIWSFGIVLYEIYTFGGTPYPGMDNHTVVAKLKGGFRMEKPKYCPIEIYQIMRQCWLEDPIERPSFKSLVSKLQNLLQTNSSAGAQELSSDIIASRQAVQTVGSDRDNLATNQIDSGFDSSSTSYVRTYSGEEDQHNLWKHLENANGSAASTQFIRDYDGAPRFSTTEQAAPTEADLGRNVHVMNQINSSSSYFRSLSGEEDRYQLWKHLMDADDSTATIQFVPDFGE